MHIEGSYEFDSKRELVWDVLMDIDVLGSIIPGSQGLQEIGENKYQSKLAVKVGPVNGKFEANFELADVDAPESYKLIVEGKGPAGHVTGAGVIRLASGKRRHRHALRRGCPHRWQDRRCRSTPAGCGRQADRQASLAQTIEASRNAPGDGGLNRLS